MDYYLKYLKYKQKYIVLKEKNSIRQIGGGPISYFDSWFRNKIRSCWDIPGISVVVFNADKILYSNVVGYANLKDKRKLKLTDKFCIASCSKSILCLAISIAIKNKKIPDIWNMKMGDIFDEIHPEFADCPIKYLANHTSGVSDMSHCPKIAKEVEQFANLPGTKSRKLISKYILTTKPAYPPNSKWEYSNIGYGILGHIVEKLSKMDYGQFIDKYVFDILNIKAKYKKYYLGRGFAEGHKIDMSLKNAKYEPLKKGEHINPGYEEPAGEIYINPLDFAKYAQQYLLAYKNRGIFDRKIYKLLTKNNKQNYGLGIKNFDKSIEHSGAYFCTKSQFKIYPKNNIGIVINVNCYTFNFREIVEKFEELFI